MIRESRGYLGIELDEAEAVAVDALAFLAGNPEELGRFLAGSGLGPGNLRAAAADPAFLAGVLDHMMADEALLLAFAGQRGISAATVAAATRRIRGREASRLDSPDAE